MTRVNLPVLQAVAALLSHAISGSSGRWDGMPVSMRIMWRDPDVQRDATRFLPARHLS
jgi:hypothetical protein